MGMCSSSLRKNNIRVGGIFHRCQRIRVRGEHAQQIPGELFKLAFLVDLMRLMGQERFVNQGPERTPGFGDCLPDVAGAH